MGAAVVVVAIVAVALLATNVFGGNKLVNGKYIFENMARFGTSYEIYNEGGTQKINIGFAEDLEGIDSVACSGTFVEDGENDQGIIWKLVPDEEYEDSLANITIRFQFPEGYAEGDVNGRWYFEQTTTHDDGTSETQFSIMEFDEDSLVAVNAYGESPLDDGIGAQDVIDNGLYDSELPEDGDIPEGKYRFSAWIGGFNSYANGPQVKISDEGNGVYHAEKLNKNASGFYYSDWMDVNLDPEE